MGRVGVRVWAVTLSAGAWLGSCGAGRGQPEGVDPLLIPAGSLWRYHVNRVEGEGPPWGWWMPEFDDAAWSQGPSGLGSGLGDEATVLERTNVVSACFRTTFVVEDPAWVRWLVLRAGFQSGVSIWLNGQEVRRINLAQPPQVWSQVPSFSWRFYTRELDLSPFLSLLRPGTNVLAAQVHSHTTNPAALFWSAELRANLTRGPVLTHVQPRSARLVWHTPTPVNTRIRYGTGPELDRELWLPGTRTNHVAVLTDLAPGREWYYRIELLSPQGEVRTPTWSFRTPPERGAIRFVVVGDTGSGTLPQLQVASWMASALMDLIVHTGDLVYPELSRELVDLRHFSVYAKLLRRVPLYPTVGNHELYNTLYRDPPGTPYFEAFDLPTNSVTGTSHFYSFDFGDAHFVSLFVPTLYPFAGTEPYRLGPETAQLRWLEEDLATTDRPWRIVFMHSPMFSSGGRRFDDLNANGIPDRIELQSWLLPVFRRHGVQVAFFGHDHVYERFVTPTGFHAWTTGGGGYMLYSFTERDVHSRRFEVRFHHLECELEGDELRVVARDRFGTVFDSAVVPRVTRPWLEGRLVRTDANRGPVVELQWNAAPGERYRLEKARQPWGPFAPVEECTASRYLEAWEVPLEAAGASSEGAVFYRVVWLR